MPYQLHWYRIKGVSSWDRWMAYLMSYFDNRGMKPRKAIITQSSIHSTRIAKHTHRADYSKKQSIDSPGSTDKERIDWSRLGEVPFEISIGTDRGGLSSDRPKEGVVRPRRLKLVRMRKRKRVSRQATNNPPGERGRSTTRFDCQRIQYPSYLILTL